MSDEGCGCQGCGYTYRVDVLLPDTLWQRVQPTEKTPGAGLLCGLCIISRIESLGQYGAFNLSVAP